MIHGTHNVTLTRNVAHDITGHCYYLEDGVEENNTLSYNLASFIKVIGRPAAGGGQTGEYFFQSDNLTNPADSAAAGFYITNAANRFIGNVASGGWSGFSFVNLLSPIGLHQDLNIDPSAKNVIEFDGNTVSGMNFLITLNRCTLLEWIGDQVELEFMWVDCCS